jgi:energy-coupling factor transporter ATP-binding protein EcfA2
VNDVDESVTAVVRQLLTDAQLLVDGHAERNELERMQLDLDQPLRVAVAGRTSAGKSTLVNALLGRRVAPTGDTDTTRVISQFRFSHRDVAEAVIKETGERVEIEFDDRMLPMELPIDPRSVDFLDVQVTTRTGILGRMTLIDTPGLGSLESEAGAATEQLLSGDRDTDERSRDAMASAQALVFLVNESLLEGQLTVVERFNRTNPGLGSARAAIGVLSQADLIDAPDPMAEAHALAAEHVRSADGALVTVIPLMGKLAETANRGGLNKDHLEQLLKLTTFPELERAHVLSDADFFRDSRELPVEPEWREQLIDLLDMTGIVSATNFLADSPASVSVGAVREHLKELSGFCELESSLDLEFTQRAEAVRARRALSLLRRIAIRPAGGGRGMTQRLRELIGLASRLDPIQRLKLVEAYAQCRAGQLSLPAGRLEDLARMAHGNTLPSRLGVETGDRDDLLAAIARGEQEWSRLAIGAGLKQGVVATDMMIAYANARADLNSEAGIARRLHHEELE